MSSDTVFKSINDAKTNMDCIYDRLGPRAYARDLEKLNYAIPDVAKPVFQKLISHRKQRQDDTVHVLDLGCSYGVNAALLKHDLTMPNFGVKAAGICGLYTAERHPPKPAKETNRRAETVTYITDFGDPILVVHLVGDIELCLNL
jgi:hypothetical protein